MHEIPTAYLHFDPPYPGLIGGTIIHGWLVPKPGRHYTDLRAVVNGKEFRGIYGIPRQDLAEFFKSQRRYLLAGFSITLTVPAGPQRIALEGLNLNGSWESLDAIEREVSAAEARPTGIEPDTLDVVSLGDALRLMLRRMGDSRDSPATVATAIINEMPGRRHLQHPPRPFHGHLDQPKIRAHSLYGRVPITGWVFHESQPIKRVFATTDLQAMQNLVYGRATPFLAGREFTTGCFTECGYDGFLDVPAQLPQPAAVRVYAEMEDGSWHLGSVTGFATTDHESTKQPYPRFSPLTFWQAWRALSGAMKVRDWQKPAFPDSWKVIRQVWQEYVAQAPRRKLARPPSHCRDKSVALSRNDAVGTPNSVATSENKGWNPASGRVEAMPTGENASSGRVPPQSIASFGLGKDSGSIHLFTHNLNHEGAPLFLLEYARHLQQETGASVEVTSAREGPLRREFEAIGATVTVVDASDVFGARDLPTMKAALRKLSGQVSLSRARLVVANTLSAFWGVHLASQAGCPVLFQIHESTSPQSFFRGHLPPSAIAAVEESFQLADRVSFLTASTRRYYSTLSDGSNYCIHPGWIDLAKIDRFRAANTRESLRQHFGLTPEQKLVINVGTVCERKGQHIFARAVDLLGQNAADLAESSLFLMIGGRDTPYDREMADFLTGLNRPNLRIIAETSEVYAYFGAADLFVCSSYEESFPRVILEAMAFGLPIVSTSVHGIPEITRADTEALLVPPGDTFALASAMQRMLAAPEPGRSLALAARTRVAAEFDSRVLIARHIAEATSLM